LVRFERTFRLPDGDLNPELQLAFIAGALVPGWSPTLDALSVSWGNQHGEYWVASCYLPDDTSVELRVDRATLQASLTVDSNPALKPLRGPPAWFNKFLLGALALGVAVGIATSSAGWGIAAAILPIAAQTAWDMFVLQPRQERAAALRTVDNAAWERKLEGALARIRSGALREP